MPVLTDIDTQAIADKLNSLRKKQTDYLSTPYRNNNGNPYTAQISQLENKLEKSSQANKNRQLVEAMIGERPDFQGVDSIDEFNTIRDMAFGEESNPYYDLQRDNARQDTRFAIDDLSGAQLGQMQNAYSQLAQQGGLSSGARERIAGQGALQGMKSRQGLRAEEMGNLADIGIAEEGTRADQQAQVTNQLATNLQNQNAYKMDTWKENNSMRMAQLKAERERKIAEANKPSCFSGDTLIMLELDGAMKPARKIEVGDRLLGGGLVYSVKKALAQSGNWYEYNDNIVTGRHAVKEYGRWVRVEDSQHAKKISHDEKYTYNFATEHHIVVATNMQIFSDMDETPWADSVSDEQSLKIKNEKTNETLRSVS